jgi:hypothetical protein
MSFQTPPTAVGGVGRALRGDAPRPPLSMTSVRSTKRATLSGDARAIVRQPRGRYVAILVDGMRATDWVLDCRRITSSLSQGRAGAVRWVDGGP